MLARSPGPGASAPLAAAGAALLFLLAYQAIAEAQPQQDVVGRPAAAVSEARAAAQVGQRAPDFELRDLDGRSVRLRDLKGSTVVRYVGAALADLRAGRPVAVSQTVPWGCSVKYGKP